MVEGQSMTVADVVAQVRDGRLEDFVKEAVALVAREMMEAEVSAEVGAGLGEIAPDGRSTHRNGYQPRVWETRVGEIDLLVPKKRSGASYFPSFLEARRPAEQAIVAVVMEAYVNGVSTRKVDRLVEQLGIGGMTKDRVSAVCRGLDERVDMFRNRPLEGAYPYLWLDAKHVKVRDQGRVVSKACVVAYAVDESGVREVIGLDVGEVESGSSGQNSFVASRNVGSPEFSSPSATTTKGSRTRSLGCWPARGSVAPFTSSGHGRSRPTGPTRPRRRRPARSVLSREPRPGPRAGDPGHRPARADRAEGLPAARGSGGGPHRLLRVPARALDQDPLYQRTRTGEQGDRPAL